MSSFSQNEKKKTKTHGKISHLERRFLAFTLVIAMCLTSMGTHFFGLLPSLGIESVTAEAKSTSDYIADYPGGVIYDAGTIRLDAYYGSPEVLNQSAWKTDNAASLCTDYATVDGIDWTLAGTTDINTNGNDGYIGCLAERFNGTAQEDDAHQTPDFGAPAPGKGNNGEDYYYVAKGIITKDAVNSKYSIAWDIKVWNKDLADSKHLALPVTQTDIAKEWDTATTNIEGLNVYSGNIFGQMAPEWESGNTHYDDWNATTPKRLDYGVVGEFWVDCNGTPKVESGLYTKGASAPDFPLTSGGVWDRKTYFSTNSDTNSMPFFYGENSSVDTYTVGRRVNVYQYIGEILGIGSNNDSFNVDDGFTSAPAYDLAGHHDTFAKAILQGDGHTAYRIYQIRINAEYNESASTYRNIRLGLSPSAFLTDPEISTSYVTVLEGSYDTSVVGSNPKLHDILGVVGYDRKSDIFVSLSYDRTDGYQRGIGGAASKPFDMYDVNITTSAVDKTTDSQSGIVGATSVITDTVNITGSLPKGAYKYTITATDPADNSVVATKDYTFTTAADETSHTETFDFPIDSSALAGKSVALSGELVRIDHPTGTPTVVAQHNVDLSDVDQKVYYPSIATTLAQTSTGNKTIVLDTTAVSLTDQISFHNLVKNEKYKFVSTLMMSDGTTAVSGAPVIEKEFTANSADVSDTADFTFNVNPDDFNGKTVVAFNKLYVYDTVSATYVLVASEEDKTNLSQTVGFNPSGTPSMTTVATDKANGTHVMSLATDAQIKDVVSMENLITGMGYKLVSEVYDKDSGSKVTSIPTVETPFTATALTMDKEVFITVDTTAPALAGKNLVVYETLYSGSTKICEHCSLADTNQTVTVPGNPTISTEAKSSTDTKTIPYSTSAVIIDKVSYEDVVKGAEYTLKTTVRYTDGTDTGITVADTKFTPSDTTGSVNVNISFNSTSFRGKDLVIYEELYIGTVKVAEHCDKTDAKQTVKVDSPTMSLVTSATYEDGTRVVPYTDTSATVTDAATYTGLDTTVNYTMTTTVVYKSSGSAVTGIDEVITTFKPSSENGTVSVDVTFDASKYQGQTFVIYEVIKDNTNKVILEHKDLNDAAQTVRITQPTPTPSNPWISTTAVDSVTKTHKMSIDKNAKIEDTVSYYDVTAGATYILHATVYDKETGNLMTDIKADKEFTPTSSNGTVVVSIPIDTTKYEGKSFVVFESLTLNGVEVANHNSLTDASQTVTVPFKPVLDTVATDMTTGTHTLTIVDGAKVVEKVSYSNVTIGGNYKLKTTVYDVTDGKLVEGFTAVETAFVPSSTTGDVTINIDAAKLIGLNGHKLVIYEELYLDNVLVAEHCDKADADQTINVPKPTLATKAFLFSDTAKNKKDIPVGSDVIIGDELTFTDLTPNQSYTIETWAVEKGTGKTITTVGKTTFAPTTASGTTTVQLHIDTRSYVGKEIVIYERILLGTKVVVEHVDINDAAQTVKVVTPSIETVATSNSSGAKVLNYSASEKIKDTITFTNFTVGEKYKIQTYVYIKETGAQASDIAVVSSEFVATENGSISVLIPVDATKHVGQTLVVYEYIYDSNNTLIAQHADINDVKQAVTVSKISTVLTGADLKSKTLDMNLTAGKAIDTITYSGLEPGQTYVLTGVLVDYETLTGTKPTETTTVTTNTTSEDTVDVSGGASATPTSAPAATRTIPADGTIATATIEFTPSAASGSVQQTFSVDTTGLYGHHLVAYETLTLKSTGAALGQHKDLNDANQTVIVKTPAIVQTGLNDVVTPFFIVSLLLFLAFLGYGAFTLISMKKKATKVVVRK